MPQHETHEWTDSTAGAQPVGREQHFAKTIPFLRKPDVQLIGFRTIRVDEAAREEFNLFYQKNKAGVDTISNHLYDPKTGGLRVYFPVRSAIVELGGRQLAASEFGGLQLEGVDHKALVAARILGRPQTDAVRGIPSNVVRDGTIFLARPVAVSHAVGDAVLVFDFGERNLLIPHAHHGMAAVPCMQNHGGPNCTIAFGVSQGRCPFDSTVCMDYNGIYSDCVNYDSGAGRYRNFIQSDCDYAMGQGHCWNEVM